MRTVRSVLNELRWREDRDFSSVSVEYVHRGAPGDLATVTGSDILALEPWMMVIERREGGPASSRSGRAPGRPSSPVPGQAAIPYHRIVRVLYEGEPVFDRSSRAGQKVS